MSNGKLVPLHKRPFNPEPMTEQQTVFFMGASLSNKQLSEEKLKGDFMYELITKRLDYHKVDADINTKVMLILVSDGVPGRAVQYCHAVAHMYIDKGKKQVTLSDIGESFPYGFYSEAELEKAWDEQKDGGANRLDREEEWPTYVEG